MALTQGFKFKGISVDSAYLRVSMVTILPGNTSMEFHVSLSAGPQEIPFDSVGMSCFYDIDGANPVEQAYAYVKSLPEYQEAIDC